MKWVAYHSIKETTSIEALFPFICSNVAKKQNIPIGLISSKEDKSLLESIGIFYSDHIEADVSAQRGAQVKLKAILEYLPEGDVICDMDVLFTREPHPIKQDCAIALNPEKIIFYAEYKGEEELISKCLPQGNVTANAGVLYIPQHQLFREYAKNALEMAETTQCIGHTYEQMYFVKFCQDKQIPLEFVYPEIIYSIEDIEKCYQSSGIRHPFAFKRSLAELQRFITTGMEFGEKDEIIMFVNKNLPSFKSMLYYNVFGLKFSA